MLRNYHSHTYRCNHAEGDAVDYAREAVKQGLTVLGVTDHTPLPDGRWSGMRMALSELPEYLDAIKLAQEAYSELRILKGMECEWAEEYHSFYEEELLGRCELDYLILGTHFFPCNGSWCGSHSGIYNAERLRAYTEHLIRSMESGLFAMVAHPDLFGLAYLEWDENTEACTRDILKAAEELQIPLEINGYGFRKRPIDTPSGPRPAYPWLPFWELAADYDIRVVVNSDAHTPAEVGASLKEGLQMAQMLGLKTANLEHLE